MASHDSCLALIVQGARRLIEQQDLRFARQGSRDEDPLGLPPEIVWILTSVCMCIGIDSMSSDRRQLGGCPASSSVIWAPPAMFVEDGPGRELAAWMTVPDSASVVISVDVTQVMPVGENLAQSGRLNASDHP